MTPRRLIVMLYISGSIAIADGILNAVIGGGVFLLAVSSLELAGGAGILTSALLQRRRYRRNGWV